jgi:hypothetical protein
VPVRQIRGFGVAAFTGEESRTVASDDGKELLQVGESDKRGER